MKITIYGREGCTFCEKALELVRPYEFIESKYLKLDEDYARDFFKEKFPKAKTFPQIVIDGENIGGYDQLVEHILRRLS